MFKELPFTASIFNNKTAFMLARVYQTLNAYCYENQQDIKFVSYWNSIANELFDFLFLFDMDTSGTDYSDEFNHYVNVIETFLPKIGINNYLIDLAKSYLKEYQELRTAGKIKV